MMAVLREMRGTAIGSTGRVRQRVSALTETRSGIRSSSILRGSAAAVTAEYAAASNAFRFGNRVPARLREGNCPRFRVAWCQAAGPWNQLP